MPWDSVSDQGLIVPNISTAWNRNRQCKLGMTWRSLPQGNDFCFAHPLLILTSMSFPILKESFIPKMNFFSFISRGGKKKKEKVWEEIKRVGQTSSVCLCSCSTREDHSCNLLARPACGVLQEAMQWWSMGCAASHLIVVWSSKCSWTPEVWICPSKKKHRGERKKKKQTTAEILVRSLLVQWLVSVCVQTHALQLF